MIDRDPSPGYHHPIETTQEFAVELPLFRGPFRLLATLILDQKVDAPLRN